MNFDYIPDWNEWNIRYKDIYYANGVTKKPLRLYTEQDWRDSGRYVHPDYRWHRIINYTTKEPGYFCRECKQAMYRPAGFRGNPKTGRYYYTKCRCGIDITDVEATIKNASE